MTHRTKSRKPPRLIVDLSRLVPLVDYGCGEWHVEFIDSAGDETDETSNTASSPATIVCLPRRSGVSVIVFTSRPNILQAISNRVDELRSQGRPVRPYRLKDRIVVDWCGPNDVLELARVVAQIEGRELAEIDSLGPSPVAPMVFVCHIGEESPAC